MAPHGPAHRRVYRRAHGHMYRYACGHVSLQRGQPRGDRCVLACAWRCVSACMWTCFMDMCMGTCVDSCGKRSKCNAFSQAGAPMMMQAQCT